MLDDKIKELLFNRLKEKLPVLESKLVEKPFPNNKNSKDTEVNIITQQPIIPIFNEKIIDKIKENLEEKNKTEK